MQSSEQIRKIAEQTRRDFEVGALSVRDLVTVALIKRPGLSKTEFPTLLAGVSGAVANFPEEACEVATDELQRRLGEGSSLDGRFIATEADGSKSVWRHVVLEVGTTDLGENTIVDITADQFGGPPVYVGPLRRPWVPLDDVSVFKQR